MKGRGSAALLRYWKAVRAIRREGGFSFKRARKLYRPALERARKTTTGRPSEKVIGQAGATIAQERKRRGQMAAAKKLPRTIRRGILWKADSKDSTRWADAFSFWYDAYPEVRQKAARILARAKERQLLVGWQSDIALHDDKLALVALVTVSWDDNAEGIEAMVDGFHAAVREALESYELADESPIVTMGEVRWDTVKA